MKYKITYGKSVHDIKEINAVIEVLNVYGVNDTTDL